MSADLSSRGFTLPGFEDAVEIGSGGFSTVYRAYEPRHDRTVAVKVLFVDMSSEKAQRQFQRECSATGRLTGHPNIVTLFDSGFTPEGRPFIAMEYMDNGSLDDRLNRDGPLPVEEVLRIGVKIGGALEAAHSAGILHRDIKPQNVLLSRFNEPELADFGIAAVTQTREASMTFDAMTPPHAPPELLEGKAPSHASDVYSLGSTLFTLLAGATPFGGADGEGVIQLLLRIMSQPVPDVPRADVGPEVMELLRHAMAKDPTDRPQTATAMAGLVQDLQRSLGHPVTERVASGVATRTPGASAETTTARVRTAPMSPGDDETGTVSGPRHVADAFDAGTEDKTVLRGRSRPEEPAGQTAPSKSRLKLLVGAGAAAAVAGVLGSTLLSGGSTDSKDSAKPLRLRAVSTSVPEGTSTTALQPELARPRPTGVRITESGSTATVAWTDTAQGEYPTVVRTAPPPGGDGLSAVPAGDTTVRVDSLDPSKGYCFWVGTIVRFGRPSTVAWSDPQCIRGATPVSD